MILHVISIQNINCFILCCELCQSCFTTFSHQTEQLVDIDDQPTCTTWSFRGIDVTQWSAGLLCQGSDRLEFIACETALTGCKQRCLSAHTEDDRARDTGAPSTIEMLCVKLRYISSFWRWHWRTFQDVASVFELNTEILLLPAVCVH